MTNSNTNLINYYLVDFWNEWGDPRAAEYPLMSTLMIPLSVLAVYLSFVLYIGPRWIMHSERKPYQLRPLLITYNLFMSLANAFFLYQLMLRTKPTKELFDVKFRPVTDRSEKTLTDMHYTYMYMLSKYVDLLDTVFFVLRKKQSQITLLHLYHHTMVAGMGWIYFRYNGAFIVTSYHFVLWNTTIHVLMYAYYGLSALGPSIQPYLWWKRYITQIQIAQFVALFLHGTYFFIYQQGYPLFFSIDILVQAAFYLFMFSRFYIQTYIKGSNKNKKLATATEVDSGNINRHQTKKLE